MRKSEQVLRLLEQRESFQNIATVGKEIARMNHCSGKGGRGRKRYLGIIAIPTELGA